MKKFKSVTKNSLQNKLDYPCLENLGSEHRIPAKRLKEWTEKEVTRFVKLLDDKFSYLANHPQIGASRNQKYPNIRYSVIHKRIAIIYKHKPAKNEIDLLVFWNTWAHPRRLKANK